MKKVILLLFGFYSFSIFAQEINPNIESYVNYLETQHTSAKDYVLNLFKKYDVVILCERNHTEMTQYDLIFDIINTPYFQKKVGNVFTEIGSISNRENTYSFTKSKFKNDSIRLLKQAKIYRNGFFPPMWYNTNFFNFVGNVYSMNRNLSKKKKVNLLTSGTKNPTKIQVKDSIGMRNYVMENYPKRDSLMASYIIKSIDSLNNQQSNRKKALVIMNYRHAFSKDLVSGESNVGTYLFEKYSGKVANVYINGLAQTNKKAQGQEKKAKMFRGFKQIPIQEGKWDAAFKYHDIEDLGFDFDNSPFGNDSFDIWSEYTNYNYKDIFTGMIFYKPLNLHINSKGVKKFLYDADFKEIVREWNLFNKVLGHNNTKTYSTKLQEVFKKETETIKESQYSNLKQYEQIINQWLN